MVDFSEVKNELWKLRLSPQFPIQEYEGEIRIVTKTETRMAISCDDLTRYDFAFYFLLYTHVWTGHRIPEIQSDPWCMEKPVHWTGQFYLSVIIAVVCPGDWKYVPNCLSENHNGLTLSDYSCFASKRSQKDQSQELYSDSCVYAAFPILGHSKRHIN